MDSWRGWPRRADARCSSAAARRAAHAWRSRYRPSSRANSRARAIELRGGRPAASKRGIYPPPARSARDSRAPTSWSTRVICGYPDDEPARSRLGVTVSRRVGIAVVRNRVKRRVREIFRRVIRDNLPAGTSIVVIARAGAATLASAAIDNELTMAARNLGARIAAKGAFAGRN